MSDPLDRAFAQQEAVAAMGGVWRTLADRCVSPPDVLQAARWKLPQLALAKRLGFRVPATLITTDPDRIERFRQAGSTVIKAVGDAIVATRQGERHGHTHALSADEPLDGVRAAPVLAQRLVAKVADIRATVVGRSVFAVRITLPPGAPIDFRITPPEDAHYEVVVLDETVVAKIRAFVGSFGLRFAAFDFAEDEHGELWFLECNPNGQWAWLEPPTGLDITGALVDLLTGPNR